MAAAAYYQQLSLSLSGNLNGGIPTPGQLFQTKDGHVTSQIATALASNPYLIHPAPSPPYSVQGTSNSINRMSFQRYYNLPEQLNSCPDTLPNNLSLRNPFNTRGLPLTQQAHPNDLFAAHENFDEKLTASDKYNAARSHQYTANEKPFPANVYGGLLPSAWSPNSIYDFKKGTGT